jgi:FtsP/CotA-like multicopper oxidase with cupredoxin domain
MTRRPSRALASAAVLAAACALLAAPAAPAASTGMQCSNGSSFDLYATTGHVETPDGNSIYMWGYSLGSAGHFQYPGPVLCVNQGAAVSVTLHNPDVPGNAALHEPTSITFAGVGDVSASSGPGTQPGALARQVVPGADTITYTFTAEHPGTYLYESGSDPVKQVEMGLKGVLVVRPTAADQAYGSAGTQFDTSREYLQLLDDVDPDLHRAVEFGQPFDINARRARYFTVNGRAFPDTLSANDVSWLPTQPYGALVRIKPYCNPTGGTGDPMNPKPYACTATSTRNDRPALIRVVNGGLLNHPYHPHGNNLDMIAQDGRMLTTPGGAPAFISHFGEIVPSGGTEDFRLFWNDQDSYSAGNNPLPPTLPSYRNLMFKDNDTWYSGSPYLGSTGTLPAGVATQNSCGELYFPWHSHALNEFVNFDAAFGGMATLLRVDPLEGCVKFPGSTAVISPTTVNSGSYTALAADDTTYYALSSGGTGGSRSTQWYGALSGVQVGSVNLKVKYTGQVSVATSGAPSVQGIAYYRWSDGTYQTVDTFNIPTPNADVTRSVSLPSAALGTGSNAGKVRIRVTDTHTGTGSFITRGDLMQLNHDAP